MIQTLDAPSSAPLYVELARSLEQLIEQGTLRPGHRLPSVRRMSLQRDVSISTVLQAYTLLENRGWVETALMTWLWSTPLLVELEILRHTNRMKRR